MFSCLIAGRHFHDGQQGTGFRACIAVLRWRRCPAWLEPLHEPARLSRRRLRRDRLDTDVDYDHAVLRDHVSRLNAMAQAQAGHRRHRSTAMQARKPVPAADVMEMASGNQGKKTSIEMDGSPLLVCSAHFGLTLIPHRGIEEGAEAVVLEQAKEDGHGATGDSMTTSTSGTSGGRRGIRSTSPRTVRLAHRGMVAIFDENMNIKHVRVPEWRKLNGIGEEDKKVD